MCRILGLLERDEARQQLPNLIKDLLGGKISKELHTQTPAGCQPRAHEHAPHTHLDPFARSGLDQCGKAAQKSRLLAAGHMMRTHQIPAAAAASVVDLVLSFIRSQHQPVHAQELRRLADLTMQV